MCGIAGIMVKQESDLGDALFRMLYEIRHRGCDAAGAALYLDRSRDYTVARVSMLNVAEDLPRLRSIVTEHAELGECDTYRTNSPYTMARLTLQADPPDLARLYRDINAEPGLCVHSLSDRMDVIKDVGTAEALAEFGRHGQLTNYFKLRRRLEAKGIRCKTFNDSEIIAHYLAHKIKREGRTFEAALRASLDDFDGVYSYLAATETHIGAVRDRLGIKPILFYQNDDLLLLGSEQVSFEAVDPDVYATEMSPGEVRIWSKN